MQEKINSYLNAAAKEKNIRILQACETGSRSWGFASADSDYDVRVLYVHEPEWYFSLYEREDNWEQMHDDRLIDISAWELRKALRLLHRSNAAMLERAQSPTVYQQQAGFMADFWVLAQQCYSRIAVMHHYLSMARNGAEEVQPQPYKLKKLFYLLRSVCITRWILRFDTVPPIDFHAVLPAVELPAPLHARVQELLHLKTTVDETYRHNGEAELLAYINTMIEEAKTGFKALPAAKVETETLQAFFNKYALEK